MTGEPLDELYFQWLYSQVGSVRQRVRSKTYWSLARQLYKKPFVWIVPNDDNRVEDGKDLRLAFMAKSGYVEVDEDWMAMDCSFLEMLIALSIRLAFEADGSPAEWFWQLIDNIGLYDLTDARYTESDARAVDRVLEIVMWRTYSRSGRGGLFPLHHARDDQREVEIWGQLNAYLIEREEMML